MLTNAKAKTCMRHAKVKKRKAENCKAKKCIRNTKANNCKDKKCKKPNVSNLLVRVLLGWFIPTPPGTPPHLL